MCSPCYRGIFAMLEGEASDTGEDIPPRLPQQSALLRRAHELLESSGQPLSEDALIKHLFGVVGKTAKNAVWKTLLRQTLKNSTLFEQVDEHAWEELSQESKWTLSAWRIAQQPLDETDFVVLYTETTGLRPGPELVRAFPCLRLRACGDSHARALRDNAAR